MGCGCKGGKKGIKNSTINLETEEIKLNLIGVLLKIPMAILVTVFFILISPIILIVVWYLAISSLFGKDSDIVKLLLFKFKKNNDNSEEMYEDDEEFNPEEYELMDVDVIK